MKQQLGQFFTSNPKVQSIFNSLIQNKTGLLLEPSVGKGDLIKMIDFNRSINIIELDNSLKADWIDELKQNEKKIQYFNHCFFKYSTKEKVKTIISNPPYVKQTSYKTIMSEEMRDFVAKEKYEGKFNLSYLFLHYSAQLLDKDGEMIFIVPKDFTYSTSALNLRVYLEAEGYFSHWIDCGEEKIFKDASLETLVVLRWQKTKKKQDTETYTSLNSYVEKKVTKKEELYYGINKSLFFVDKGLSSSLKQFNPLSTYFNVYVGSVSGADEVFKVDEGFINKKNKHLIDRFTSGAGKKEYYINLIDVKEFSELPQDIQNHLEKHKEKLLNRYGVKDETWWQWSFLRNANLSLRTVKKDRIFTFSKTRNPKPFELGDHNGFVGATYAMFPNNKQVNLEQITKLLNSSFYKSFYLSCGMAVNTKFQATPSVLKDLPLPPMDKIASVLKAIESKDVVKELNKIFK